MRLTLKSHSQAARIAFRTALAVAGFTALSFIVGRPVMAQELTYTLSGVTFDDGAIATGYFDFNPTTQTFGLFDITTTNGVTDALVGAEYKSGSSNANYLGYGNFDYNTGSPVADLSLSLTLNSPDPSNPLLIPGTVVSPNELTESGEFTAFTRDIRAITGGSVQIGITPAPVPEASTKVSLGLLLALGMGGVVIAARKKKAAASA